jgi:hypothetical protein
VIIATQRENRTPPRPTGVVGQFVVSKIDCLTEPSAGRGPQRGSPPGVVDAPDAGVKLRTKQLHTTRARSADGKVISAGPRIVYHFSPELTLAPGATALGSVRAQASLNHTDPLLPTGRIVDNNWAGRVKINPANLYDG